MTGRALMESHVDRFNEGVRSGDWEPMLVLEHERGAIARLVVVLD